jgi:hypothetical protein
VEEEETSLIASPTMRATGLLDDDDEEEGGIDHDGRATALAPSSADAAVDEDGRIGEMEVDVDVDVEQEEYDEYEFLVMSVVKLVLFFSYDDDVGQEDDEKTQAVDDGMVVEVVDGGDHEFLFIVATLKIGLLLRGQDEDEEDEEQEALLFDMMISSPSSSFVLPPCSWICCCC